MNLKYIYAFDFTITYSLSNKYYNIGNQFDKVLIFRGILRQSKITVNYLIYKLIYTIIVSLIFRGTLRYLEIAVIN